MPRSCRRRATKTRRPTTHTAAGRLALRARLTDYGNYRLPDRHGYSTVVNYSSAERRWREFCLDCGYHWSQWSDEVAFQFAAWRRTVGTNMRTGEPVKARTITQNLSGIRAALMNHGVRHLLPRNKYLMPRTHALLKALGREEKASFKRPLTAAQLHHFCTLLSPGYDAAVYTWLFAMIHNTMRRAAEVMPRFTAAIVAGDITWSNGTYRPRLQPPYDMTASYAFSASKTNTTGRLQTAFLWCRCSEIPLCALCALRRLYSSCPWQLTPSTPLLLMANGTVIAYSAAMATLKRLCEKSGLDPAHYGLHSLRRGGYHDAETAQHPDALINSQAFWRSNRSRRPYERQRVHLDAAKLRLVQTIPREKVTSRGSRSSRAAQLRRGRRR